MPELPEVTAYVEALAERVVGEPLERLRIPSPSLLRSVDPAPAEAQGRKVRGIGRLGKRVVLDLEEDVFLVVHLMIAGRFRWRARGAAVTRRVGHAAFDFPDGTLLLTEQGTRKRASLHIVRGRAALMAHDRGGVEPLEVDVTGFGEALRRENRTLKRALTDPRLISGIGNAHSDEILWLAGLSPVQLTHRLDDQAVERLHEATRSSLERWVRILREERAGGFPERITAFHPRMAVHGRFRAPCLRCAAPIQRIVYATRETNYCVNCQTGGRLLADRSFSRLLREDWPRTLEALEEMEGG